MKTTDVRIWKVRTKRRQGKDTFEVRWGVAGRPFSRSRATQGLADKLRARLLMAQEAGEQFDTESGLPGSMEEQPQGPTWYEFALSYMGRRWPMASPNYRDEINESLTAVTKAILPKTSGRPADMALQRALRDWAFVLPGPNDREIPADSRAVLNWVAENSPPLSALDDRKLVHTVLDALKLKLDGTQASTEFAKRKRKGFVAALNYATEIGEFAENPVGQVKETVSKKVVEVDPRVVANPRQAANLIDATSYVGSFGRARGRRLVGMFGAMYYAGIRPAEAVGLALPDCYLPKEGWGSATLHRTRPTVGKKWTKTGEVHDDRGLKNRAPEDVRVVPLPPVLVWMLLDGIETFGVADDGRLFFNERGGVVGSSTYGRVWSEAREFGLPPELVASPLAGIPYDLRHAALSAWLNAGMDPTEAARRAGNSVEVLLARYAKCIHGRAAIANQKVESFYAEYV
ncbi:tyrosine-type recombinase/integrase [Streptomyces sp. NPDC004435]|uniref:tyrosine-type recombinase/integrase n=1 Tax=Streptomyces sp. NPDC004435 TaxID=3364701 RepID=UPI0036B0EE20